MCCIIFIAIFRSESIANVIPRDFIVTALAHSLSLSLSVGVQERGNSISRGIEERNARYILTDNERLTTAAG